MCAASCYYVTVSVIQKSESNSRSFKNDLAFWARKGKIKKGGLEKVLHQLEKRKWKKLLLPWGRTRPVLAGYRKSWSKGTSSPFRAVDWRREVAAGNQGSNQEGKESHKLSPTLCSSAMYFHLLVSGGGNLGGFSEQTYGSSRSKKRIWTTGLEGRRPDSADIQTQMNCAQKRIFLAASITLFPFSFSIWCSLQIMRERS